MHIEDLLTTIILNLFANVIYDCIKMWFEFKNKAQNIKPQKKTGSAIPVFLNAYNLLTSIHFHYTS